MYTEQTQHRTIHGHYGRGHAHRADPTQDHSWALWPWTCTQSRPNTGPFTGIMAVYMHTQQTQHRTIHGHYGRGHAHTADPTQDHSRALWPSWYNWLPKHWSGHVASQESRQTSPMNSAGWIHFWMLNFGLALAHRCAQNCPVCWELIEMATLMTLQVGCLTGNQDSLFLHFNNHFPGRSGLAGTRMSPFWILLELRRWCWQLEVYKTCKDPVKLSPPTNQHPVFLQAGWPSCHPVAQPTMSKAKCHSLYPTNIVKSLTVLTPSLFVCL